MIRFCSLGSGSSGNATVVEATSGITTTRLLIDAGFSLRELDAAAGARRARSPTTSTPSSSPTSTATTSAARVALAERHELPLWMSRGTWRAIGEPRAAGARCASPATARRSRSATSSCSPFTVAHDAAEPLQLRCSDGARRLGVLTDLGSITAHMLEQHLPAATRSCSSATTTRRCWPRSRYPPSLKARIGGRYGHLSNATAAELLAPRRTAACASSSPPT